VDRAKRAAVRYALKINDAVRKIINPALSKQYSIGVIRYGITLVRLGATLSGSSFIFF